MPRAPSLPRGPACGLLVRRMAEMILLIRHAEKPDPNAGIAGVSLQGRRDPEGLAVRGWQRAGALAVRFGAPDVAGRDAAWPRPLTLFAAVDPGRSHRPHLTLQPLSERLGVPILPLRCDDAPGAAAALSGAAGPVLACWRHRELPALAHALMPGPAVGVPAQWDEARFDLVWRIGPDGFTIVPQRLLAGDR